MKRWVFVAIWGCLTFLPFETGFAAGTVFGRYYGVLRHSSIQRDQLVKLDFISAKEQGTTLELMAVITLHFGDFKSNEYVAYHFDNVKFNLLNHTLVFDQPSQDISIVVKRFSEKEIVADFRSNFSGELSELILQKDSQPDLKFPLIESVGGEYSGRCKSKITGEMSDTVVQLQTYRSMEGAGAVGNPFRSYRIRGQLAEKGERNCAVTGSSNLCHWGMYTNGAYNFYQNKLNLFGSYRNLSCSTEADGLLCNDCEKLNRTSKETSSPRTLQPTAEFTAFSNTVASNPSSSLQGEYKGYVYHEYLGLYQPASINLLAYQSPSGGGTELKMSAVATIYFGGFESQEAISYRFSERLYPNPLSPQNFLFKQSGTDVDAILQVTSLGNGIVKGVWFSQMFGRVGEFLLQKDGLPSLPAGAKVYEAISGNYDSTLWEVDLNVGLGVAPPNTENPFYPLSLEGNVRMRDITPNIRIRGGSFDFYTGKIGIEFDEKSSFVGFRKSRKWLYLKKTYFSSLSPMPSHEPMPFILRSEP